jgi:hypothetical protein
MYVPVEKCATSDIRSRLHALRLPSSKPRSESIRLLKEHNVFVLDVEVLPTTTVRGKKHATTPSSIPLSVEYTPPPPPPISKNLFEHVNVFDVTGTETPQAQALTQQTTTDAVFSHAAIRNLVVGGSLNVDGYDIVSEIERIKHLRFLLLQDFESIRVSFDNMRTLFQQTVNQDLPMYNLAHDIAHESFWTTIQFHQTVVFSVQSHSFYGKIEDTTINLDMNFVLEFDQGDTNRSDRFDVRLPHPLDTTVLNIVPVMVTVYFDYNTDTDQYNQVSSISHGYIDSNSPGNVTVYASVLKDLRFSKYQFDIAARYLCTVDDNTITPVRFGSLHKQTFVSENGNVAHQWSDLDNRVDLFTNIVVSSVPMYTDTIDVPLPVPMVDSAIQNVVGFGSVHYTTNIPALNQVVYTTNTPLVYVSETESTTLKIKSTLFKGFQSHSANNIQTMRITTHISYQRGVPNDYVLNVKLSSDTNRITWSTKTPLNPFYFDIIRVNNTDVLPTLVGSQTTWSVSTIGTSHPYSLYIQLNNSYIYDAQVSN